jgi:hypothetical protein
MNAMHLFKYNLHTDINNARRFPVLDSFHPETVLFCPCVKVAVFAFLAGGIGTVQNSLVNWDATRYNRLNESVDYFSDFLSNDVYSVAKASVIFSWSASATSILSLYCAPTVGIHNLVAE